MKVAALILAIFLAAVSAAGQVVSTQRKLIDNDERSRIESAAAEKSRTLSRRSHELRETFVNGVIVKTVEIVHEGTFDGKQRSSTKTSEEGRTDEKQIIIIGETLYFRDFNGTWKRSEEKVVWQLSPGKLSRPSSGSQYSIETVVLKGRKMQMLDIFLVNQEDDELSYEHRQVWIGEDGLTHKIERTKGRLAPKTVTYRSVEAYEYDPNIKVEAPMK